METRKLQRVGGGTFTVSIPKAWALENGLEAGSEVHLHAHGDGSIVVRSSEKDGEALGSVTLAVDGDAPALVARALRAAHAAGYDGVTLRPGGEADAFTDEQRKAARRTKRHLVGTEVVVERDDALTLRNLLSASDVSVRQSVVQLQFVAVSVHRQATAAFLDAERLDRERLAERAAEADRLAGMVTRHFGRSLTSMEEVDRLGASRSRLFDYCETARELARVADLGASIGRAAEAVAEPAPGPVADELADVAESSRQLVDAAATAVLEGPDVDAVAGLLDDRDEVFEAIEAVERALFEPGEGRAADFDGSTAGARALVRVLDGLDRSAESGGSIAEIALRAATRDERG